MLFAFVSLERCTVQYAYDETRDHPERTQLSRASCDTPHQVKLVSLSFMQISDTGFHIHLYIARRVHPRCTYRSYLNARKI